MVSEKILSGSQPEGRGSAPVVVSEHITYSLLSIAETRREEFGNHASEKKRKGNT
jgi:hypothetical protein